MKTLAAVIAGVLIGKDQDGWALLLLLCIWAGAFDSDSKKS